jgi:hypothetical protein
MGPGRIFTTFGHAAELGIGRLQDEIAFLQAACKSKRTPFDLEAFWHIHAAELEQSVPNPRGRPARDAKPVTERAILALFLHSDFLEWIHENAQPKGPFVDASPVPHAVETALRVLRALDNESDVRSSRFEFDGDALWTSYKQAQKAAG